MILCIHFNYQSCGEHYVLGIQKGFTIWSSCWRASRSFKWMKQIIKESSVQSIKCTLDLAAPRRGSTCIKYISLQPDMAAILKSRFLWFLYLLLLGSCWSIPCEILPLSAFTKTSWMFFDEVSVTWWKCRLGPNLKFTFTISEGMLEFTPLSESTLHAAKEIYNDAVWCALNLLLGDGWRELANNRNVIVLYYTKEREQFHVCHFETGVKLKVGWNKWITCAVLCDEPDSTMITRDKFKHSKLKV